ncbi:hypothetical protein JCM8115_005875 [Rhodotorula mucilaginosa]
MSPAASSPDDRANGAVAASASTDVTKAIEVPPLHLIHAEVLAVTSAMRKNQRWASAASTSYPYVTGSSRLNGSQAIGGAGISNRRSNLRSRPDEAHNSKQGRSLGLMGGFSELRLMLRDIQDPSELDAVALLHPFLEVIRSPETSGPITAAALASIDKFISYSILSPASPNLSAAMVQLSSAGTHCKFEASDSVSDEVVLLRILDLLRTLLTGPLSGVLSDESVCEMMETGLSMCCQMRLSEMLRRCAERTMQAMVTAVFTRLRQLPTSAEEDMASNALSRSGSSADLVDADRQNGSGPRMTAPDPSSIDVPAAASASNDPPRRDSQAGEAQQAELEQGGESDERDAEYQPFGLASIQEVLRVLISLLNPHDQQHTDTMRLMALGLLNIAFEVAGESMGRFASLRIMVADHLCKHLFQLARSDHTQLLAASLRVTTNIFDTMRPHLKLQQELFLSFLLDRLVLPASGSAPSLRKVELETQLDRSTWAQDLVDPNERPSTPTAGSLRDRDRDRHGAASETRELMLEILSHFVRGKHAATDLWVNYDCNVEGEDVLERLVKFLSRGVFAPQQTAGPPLQDQTQLMCLDTLLDVVANMATRTDSAEESAENASLAADVIRSKTNKRVLLDGAAAFNVKPKVGLKFLEEHGVIYNDDTISREESLARFLKTTPRLDKRLLGDFISRPDQIDLLRAFMRLMDFDGKIICDAMRELLEAFRLPGESQQINRITETFAEVYFATQPPEIRSQDATYVLAYSVIMLNTDLHNPQVRKRMDLEAYSRNLRGVNDNQDFAPEYLQSIYESIRKREIVLPEEHQNQVGFEYGWKELMRRSREAGRYVETHSGAFDRGIFDVIWRPTVSALSYAFANFQDDYTIQRTIGGFNHCAALAARFDMPDVFDYLVSSLSRVSGLVQAPSATAVEAGNFPGVEVEGQMVTVSPLAVRFGLDVKAQLAAMVLFTIAKDNGRLIRRGWQPIFEIYQSLFAHSLLPAPMLMLEDFLSGASAIPLKPKAAPVPRAERRGDGGLLSTLSSYLLSPYGAENDMAGTDFTDDDVETTLSAMDCIASCRVEELYLQIFDLQGEALAVAVKTLIELVQRATTERLRLRAGSGSSSGSATNSPQINVTASRVQLPYDPSAVFLLEVFTSVVARSGPALAELWPTTLDLLSRLIASASSFSSLFNERVVAALLRLIAEVIKIDELRDSCFLALDTLRSLPPPILSSVAQPLMAGLSKVFLENASRVQSATEWNLLFALLSATAQEEEAAKISMEFLRHLASGRLGAKLSGDNYAAFLQTLAAFGHIVRSSMNDDEFALSRGLQIVDILREVQTSIPDLISMSDLSPARAWEAAWIPLLSAYAQLCLNPARELRQNAISSLQRTLLAPEILQNTDVDLTIIFERVFFPLLEELLKPQVFRRDPDGMGETRLRASALLCKIFLQYLTQLSQRQGMHTMTALWLKILGYQDRLMHSGRRDQMFEAVPELLKNVLLVMNASGFLLPPSSPRNEDQARLWTATFERIQPFLPELQRELFPPPPVPVPFTSASLPPTQATGVQTAELQGQVRPEAVESDDNLATE